jgi:hypothetical protein
MSTVGNWRGANIVKDGLVLYLDAGSPNSFYSPTAGTTWKDISGNGINGTLTNGPTFNTGSGGNIVFDGVDDYVNLGDNSIWDFGQNGTIEMVVRPTNSTINDRLWCIDNNSSNLDAYLDSTGYNVYMHGAAVGTTFPLTQNQWNYLTVTYTVGTIQIYINGIARTMTGTTTGYNITNNSINNSNLYIGCYRTLSFNIHGGISLFRIYNCSLSSTEVLQNYNATKGRFGL